MLGKSASESLRIALRRFIRVPHCLAYTGGFASGSAAPVTTPFAAPLTSPMTRSTPHSLCVYLRRTFVAGVLIPNRKVHLMGTWQPHARHKTAVHIRGM